MPRTSRPRPSTKARGLVDRAMFWHLNARTRIYHGPGAYIAQRKQKDRALRARRLLLAELVRLERIERDSELVQ